MILLILIPVKEMKQKMKDNTDDFSSRKEIRRKNIQQKHNKHQDSYDESFIKDSIVKQEIKKKKQYYEDLEWEDWDRYYNH